MLLLSVVLLKAIHAMTFCTKFLLFVSICVPPNNPITVCGATPFPGYQSFPKWAINVSKVGERFQRKLENLRNYYAFKNLRFLTVWSEVK